MEKVQHTAGAGASDRITADEVDLMFKVWGPSHRLHARVPCLPCRATVCSALLPQPRRQWQGRGLVSSGGSFVLRLQRYQTRVIQLAESQSAKCYAGV